MIFRNMPFGKHKGTPIDQVPLSYIEWLLEKDNVDGWLRSELEESRRKQLGGPFDEFRHEFEDDLQSRKIRKIYLELSRKWHPDKGGSHEAMAALNMFHEKLIEELT